MEASNQLYSTQTFNGNKDLDEMLESKDEMMDALGINQHHDAITGTGVQAVADDYAHRLYIAMKNNTKTYSDLLASKVGDAHLY
jgi:hypothetical protein